MKKIVLYVSILILGISLGYTYSASNFENSLKDKEQQLENKFTDMFEIQQNQHNSLKPCLIENFNLNDAKLKIDTTIEFLLLPISRTMTKFDNSYLECLNLSCEYESQKYIQFSLLDKKLKEIVQNTYPSVKEVDSKINFEFFFHKELDSLTCSKYFSNYQNYTLIEKTLKEYKSYLLKLKENDLNISKFNSAEKSKLQNSISSAKRVLNETGEQYFFDRYIESDVLLFRDSTINFVGDYLGTISTHYLITSFDPKPIEYLIKNAQEEQYKYNSLSTGSMPYANCFGSSNYCSGYNCSQIRIYTPSSSDVLVSIKKNNQVIRHAYIRAGSKYTFEIPDGAYQTFFYYGKGWHPNKEMNSSTCSYLKGAFLSNVHVGKGDVEYLSGNILTYELILQSNGNFSEQSSSTNEAF